MNLVRSITWTILFLLFFAGLGYMWILTTNHLPKTKTNSLPSITIKPTQSSASISAFPSLTGSASANIIVHEPLYKQTVGNAFIVSGEARVFENVVSIKLILLKNQKTIVSATTMAQAPDAGQFGAYAYTVHLPTNSGIKDNDELQLVVFQTSAKDGSEKDAVKIPLLYQGKQKD